LKNGNNNQIAPWPRFFYMLDFKRGRTGFELPPAVLSKENPMKTSDRPLDWGNIFFLTLSPLLAVVGGIYCASRFGVHAGDIALFVALFFATGLSITAGYHRHFAHVSYQAHPMVRILYLIFGSCAFQNSALNWAADHRLHHRF